MLWRFFIFFFKYIQPFFIFPTLKSRYWLKGRRRLIKKALEEPLNRSCYSQKSKEAKECLTGRADTAAMVAFLTLTFLEMSNFNPVTEPGVSVSLGLPRFWKGQKESFFMTGRI